ncbi:hypothetical protein [Streptomyces sp. SCA2-2]|uniref:hypothetical protein n=1 Tax=Streptomyces sp. SCA2-2 TaxID=1563677 RepID=UPI001F5D2678|nr:hypothetical protein [Streptomyces sp. SCA2-2]
MRVRGVLAGRGRPQDEGEPVAVAAERPLSITYVARECPRYSDIMADKARNNIQESLCDLGPDSDYSTSEAVSAQKEAAAPRCRRASR